jgi:hypothetical protein
MSTATSSAMQRATSPTTARTQGVAPRAAAEPTRLLLATEEAAVLNIDLGGIQVPKVGGLQVDGFKPSFFERLFGKR